MGTCEKQRLERRIVAHDDGRIGEERGPRSEPGEQVERLADRAAHVGDGRRELLERRDRHAEPGAGLVADRRGDARRRRASSSPPSRRCASVGERRRAA